MRVSSESSGWKVAAIDLPCRTATGTLSLSLPSVARTSTPGPTRVIFGARMKTISRGGAEGGLQADELLQFFETFFSQQFQECAGLASRDDEAVDVVELPGLFDQHNFGAQLFEPAAVSIEISLQGQYSDFHAALILPEIHARNGSRQAAPPQELSIPVVLTWLITLHAGQDPHVVRMAGKTEL